MIKIILPSFIIVLCCIYPTRGLAPVKSKCPPRRSMEADHCASKLFIIGNRGSLMPRNINEMATYCSTIKRAGKCLKTYSSECLPPFPKQLSTILYHAVDNSSARLCNTPQGKQEFVKKSSCVNNNLDPMHDCMEKYIENLEQIKKADSRNKIAFTCCSSQSFRTCMESELTKGCPRESFAYLHEMVMSYAREVLDTLCGAWSGSDSKVKCARLPALPPREGRSSRSLSPYTPIMEIFSAF